MWNGIVKIKSILEMDRTLTYKEAKQVKDGIVNCGYDCGFDYESDCLT